MNTTYTPRQKAFHKILQNVIHKYPHYVDKHQLAISYAILNKVNEKSNGKYNN
jgi:hypothetical protein